MDSIKKLMRSLSGGFTVVDVAFDPADLFGDGDLFGTDLRAFP
jgi:hypothetical protein